ncbi:MAG: hypothetical protein HOO96_06325 [Polyangiaceae bacterium]|nr:hypothetical protein [Polyangiaceae bacterium]
MDAVVDAAFAQRSTLPVQVETQVPAGCVDTFADDLSRRAGRVRIATDAPTHVRVRVEAQPGGYRGEVELVEEAGTTRRALEGATCEEVIDGLAMVAALAVDPQADTSPRALDAGVDATADAERGLTPPPADAGIQAEPADAGAQAAPVDAGQSGGWSWAGGANAEMASVVPSPELGFGAFVEVLAHGPGLWTPAFRGRALLSLPANVMSAAGSGRFQWAMVTLDACPLHLRLGTFFSAAPCLGMDLGGILARGEGGTVASVEETRPWVALRTFGRLALHPLRWARIELEGGPVVPFVREEFVFQPSPTVFRSPALFLFAGLSLVAQFR